MKIRPASKADRPRIHEILVATGSFNAQETGWALELVDLGLLQPQRGEYQVHVIESPARGQERKVQGYVLLGPTPMADGVFDLYWIAVDPAAQGKGLGQQLLQFVENEVRRQDGRMLLIETSSRRSNAPTRRFYERAGYHEISRIKDFYRIEDDKVVLSKILRD